MANLATSLASVSRLAASGTGARVMGFGDSFIERGSSAGQFSLVEATHGCGILPMLEALSYGKFRYDHALNKGVAGQTSGQILARYNADVRANLDKFDVLYVSTGRNDVRTTVAEANVTIANITAICDLARRDGKIVFLEIPNPPRQDATTGPAAWRQLSAYINVSVRAYAAKTPGVYYLDFWRDWVDATATSGNNVTNMLVADGLHPGEAGAMFAARRIIEQVGHLFPDVGIPQAQWDAYDSALNPAGNILGATQRALQGTGGTVAAPGTGSMATGFSLNYLSGTGVVACSKEAGVSGYGSSGTDRQVLTLSSIAAGAQVSLRCPIITPSSPELLVGRRVESLIEVELTGVTNCNEMALWQQHFESGQGKTVVGLLATAGRPYPFHNTRILLRTPPALVTATPDSFRFDVIMTFATGASGVLKFSMPTVRVLP